MPRPRTYDLDEELDLAVRVFWERGYRDTSIQDLVERTGVQRYGLEESFGERHGLFLAALQLSTVLTERSRVPSSGPRRGERFRNRWIRKSTRVIWRGSSSERAAMPRRSLPPRSFAPTSTSPSRRFAEEVTGPNSHHFVHTAEGAESTVPRADAPSQKRPSGVMGAGLRVESAHGTGAHRLMRCPSRVRPRAHRVRPSTDGVRWRGIGQRCPDVLEGRELGLREVELRQRHGLWRHPGCRT